MPRQLKQSRDKLERQDGWQLEKGLGWVGRAGTIEDMDQCIALRTGLFLIEFVSLAPFAHRPGSDWGEHNQSDTRNDMTLLTLQRFQLLMNFFASPFSELSACLPRCCSVDLQGAKCGQDSGTDVCSTCGCLSLEYSPEWDS